MTARRILNFHGIGEPGPTIPADERPYWVSDAFFADIVAAIAARHPRGSIGFTFDDGNASDLALAAPRLAAAGLDGGFFILTGRLDQPGYLSAADCRQLAQMGMQVGLHGRDHVDWRQQDDALLTVETVAARDHLATVLGQPVDAVAIPFGAYNRRVIRHLHRAGFRRIYTSDGGAPGRGRVRNRTSIRSDMSLDDVLAIAAGREAVARRVRRQLSTFVRRHLR